MEKIVLTTPVVTPSITDWKVDEIWLRWGAARIDIVLKGPLGEEKRHIYSGPEATTLMVALNKANLATTSLHKRVINKLVADGVLVGTVSGSPD